MQELFCGSPTRIARNTKKKKIFPLRILVILQNWDAKRTTEDLGRRSGLLSLSLCSLHLPVPDLSAVCDRPASGQHGHGSCQGKACVLSSYYKMETCCPFWENTLCNCAGRQNKYKVLQSTALSKHS